MEAATAASVGVKMPLAMPPISSTGVMIGSTASNLKIQSATNSSTIATMVAHDRIGAEHATPQTANGNPITIDNSSMAFPTRDHSNLMSGAPVVLVRVVRDREHHQHRHHEAGHDAGQEQRADRRIRDHAVDDERQRWRDDRPQRRRGRGDADRELLRVAVVAHRLDLDRAEPRGVRDRRAGQPREDDAADDVHMAQAAFHPADEPEREVIDAVGDAGRVHQVAGEDEERHGQQREAVDAADHPVHDRHRRRALPVTRM